eukprot:CAMPEP_0182573346 /NCGR_PEP_ID=MMETSP1324-20130603/19647_1 /TAXON_ID=236786 /ORGANISM="Florenciella sp., Strain RCC1587" /LENGTH=387 /DNA_ID=CAMNT_0024788439 /DNA_START=55 /DNA_END=1219 /DNA_ORIENTATION=+
MAAANDVAQKAKGDVLYTQAEAMLNKKSMMSFFTPKGQKFEDAAELFSKAGNAYKRVSAWQEAGESYAKCGECYLQLGEGNFDCSKAFEDAGDAYVHVNPQEAVNAWRQAIEIYSDNGRWNACGKLQKQIAEIYEKGDDNNDSARSVEDAITAYEQAEQFFQSDSRTQLANQCSEKVALLCAEQGELVKAASKFQDLTNSAMEKKLTSFNAKNHVVKAIACLLAAEDTVAARSTLDDFMQKDYAFDGTREHVFITGVIEGVENLDLDGFSAACAEYNKIKKIDPWMTSMLLKSRRIIQSQVEGDDEGAGGDDGGAEEEEALLRARANGRGGVATTDSTEGNAAAWTVPGWCGETREVRWSVASMVASEAQPLGHGAREAWAPAASCV